MAARSNGRGGRPKQGAKHEHNTKSEPKFDWSAADALTEEEIHAAALADPDARPLTEERLARCASCRAPSPSAAR